MSRARTLVGVAGVVATGAAAVAVARPSLLLSAEPIATAVARAEEVDLETLLLATSAAVGAYVAWSSRRGTDDRLISERTAAADRFERVLDEPPESVQADAVATTGGDLDAAFERAVAEGDPALAEVRGRLTDLAVSTLSQGRRSEEEASRAVARGEWTDDRTAAAFLSGSEGPVPSLLSRLRLWLDPETERERRIRRTLAAIRERGGEHR